MSFIYPRLINISRPIPTTGIGALGYQGLDPTQEEVIATALPASIQQRGGTKNLAALPADTKSRPTWQIFIPRGAAALGLIQERDIVTDDLGKRYQVDGAYWDSLGYNLECELLFT